MTEEKTKNIVAIVQARMGSTRLPGKVLEKIGNLTMLECVISRVKQSRLIDIVCVATSDRDEDAPIADLAGKYDVEIFRGDNEDVLSRYNGAARMCDCDSIVRVTADCPLIDSEVIDYAIREYYRGAFDYLSNTIERTYPRGMDVEVFAKAALQKANDEATKKYQREHVTPYIWENNNQFKIGQIKAEDDYSRFRLTVDTKKDIELVREIYERVVKIRGDKFKYKDLIMLLENEPRLLKINEGVKQKSLR